MNGAELSRPGRKSDPSFLSGLFKITLSLIFGVKRGSTRLKSYLLLSSEMTRHQRTIL